MSENAKLLEVKGLKVHFPIEKGIVWKRRVGSVRAVDGVDFHLSKGEALGLVGESGCGKSTTAMAVAQLERATAGQVILEGQDLRTLSPENLRRARMNFQIVFQDPYSSLNPRMKAGDIIAEPLRIYSRRGILNLTEAQIAGKTAALMDRCGLASNFSDRYPHEFSGGQPVSALDVSIQSQILNLLKDLQKEFDLTFLFIAHDLAVIEYFCDRIAVMYLGRIVETAPSAELYRNTLHPYSKALLSAIPMPDPAQERKRSRIILKGDVPSPSAERTGCPFRERCPVAVERCAHETPSLPLRP